MKTLCSVCGDRHESYQAHVFATNRIQAATNKETDEFATNAPAKSKDHGSGAEGDRAKVPTSVSASGLVPEGAGKLARSGSVGRERAPASEKAGEASISRLEVKTKNRRSRDSYNAYQREYMRKRRAGV